MMSDVEYIVNFSNWSATTFSMPFSSSISSYLKVSKISESWLTFLCLVMAWRNGSASGESVFSLQCSDSTPSLPSEINSSSFSQGSRVGFPQLYHCEEWWMIWLDPCVDFRNYLQLHCIAPWDFVVVEMETYLSLENWEQMWILQEYL